MSLTHDYFHVYFTHDSNPPPQLESFRAIDKDNKRIEGRPIEYVDSAEGKKNWTEFWKLFLENLKLLMLYNELKEERQLVAKFPVQQLLS